MFNGAKKTCSVEGCEQKQLRGKQCCVKHLKEKRSQVMSTEQQSLIRSLCCNASCTTGKKHEYGEQYCKRCELACCWKFAASQKAVLA